MTVKRKGGRSAVYRRHLEEESSDNSHSGNCDEVPLVSDSISIISDCKSRASRASGTGKGAMIISRPQHTYASSQQEKLVAFQSKKKRSFHSYKSRENSEKAHQPSSSHSFTPADLPEWAQDLSDEDSDSDMDRTFYSKQSTKTKEMLTKQLGSFRRELTTPLEEDAEVSSSCSRESCNSSTDAVDSQASCPTSAAESSSDPSIRSGERGRSLVRRKVPMPRRDSRWDDEDEDSEDAEAQTNDAPYRHPTSPARRFQHANHRSNFKEGNSSSNLTSEKKKEESNNSSSNTTKPSPRLRNEYPRVRDSPTVATYVTQSTYDHSISMPPPPKNAPPSALKKQATSPKESSITLLDTLLKSFEGITGKDDTHPDKRDDKSGTLANVAQTAQSDQEEENDDDAKAAQNAGINPSDSPTESMANMNHSLMDDVTSTEYSIDNGETDDDPDSNQVDAESKEEDEESKKEEESQSSKLNAPSSSYEERSPVWDESKSFQDANEIASTPSCAASDSIQLEKTEAAKSAQDQEHEPASPTFISVSDPIQPTSTAIQPKLEPEVSALPDLHVALQSGAPLTEIYRLARAAKEENPSILEFRDVQGNTPLHIACMVFRNKSAASVQWWNPITRTTTTTTIVNTVIEPTSQGTQLAVRSTAVGESHRPYYDGDSLLLVIQLLYNLCPRNIERVNRDGNLPLHLAILSATATIKTLPSDCQTNTVVSHGEQEHDDSESGSVGTTTLATSKVWLEIIGKMIFEYPKALHVANKRGQVPLDLAIHKMGTCPEIVSLIQEEIRLLGDNFSSVGSDNTSFASTTERSVMQRLLACGMVTSMPPASTDSVQKSQMQQSVSPTGDYQDIETPPMLNSTPSTPILFESGEIPSSSSKFPPVRRLHWSGNYGIKAAIWAFLNSKAAMVAVFLLTFAGLMLLPQSATHRPVRVAFIGNSITFVNDLPRFMEAISNGHITQNSCLHGATRLRTILNTGNGMFNKWQTENALIKEVTPDDDLYNYVPEYDDDGFSYGDPYPIYDFGACTVEQLLLGTDPYLSAYNENGQYTDDGKNACFQDPLYLRYQQQKYLELVKDQPQEDREDGSALQLWDYVVLNDQTQVPAIEESREQSENVLSYVYAPYLSEIKAKPVFLMTHAYSINATVNFDEDLWYIWEDVPTFTSALYQGYLRYMEVLTAALPPDQAPLLAPAGLAFLVVWEENYQMWERLFFVDGFHPTPHGTFLIGCVLYATIYGKMPANIPEDVDELWARARRMHIGSDEYNMPIPSRDEAVYLAKVAERVTLRNHMPKSYVEDVPNYYY